MVGPYIAKADATTGEQIWRTYLDNLERLGPLDRQRQSQHSARRQHRLLLVAFHRAGRRRHRRDPQDQHAAVRRRADRGRELQAHDHRARRHADPQGPDAADRLHAAGHDGDHRLRAAGHEDRPIRCWSRSIRRRSRYSTRCRCPNPHRRRISWRPTETGSRSTWALGYRPALLLGPEQARSSPPTTAGSVHPLLEGQAALTAPTIIGDWIAIQTNGLFSNKKASSVVVMHKDDAQPDRTRSFRSANSSCRRMELRAAQDRRRPREQHDLFRRHGHEEGRGHQDRSGDRRSSRPPSSSTTSPTPSSRCSARPTSAC